MPSAPAALRCGCSYDEERAKEAPDTLDSAQRPTGMWVVLSVQLKAKQRVKASGAQGLLGARAVAVVLCCA